MLLHQQRRFRVLRYPIPMGSEIRLRGGDHLLNFYRIHQVFSSPKFDESFFLVVKRFDEFEDACTAEFQLHNAGRVRLPTRHRVA
jgi:hypothetical protein